ncbi:hypothetical protein SAMN02745119_02162 [Trichlorobacter thiogenes]|uniref:DUF309 domain-containing protein n=1 Tax=Trichlorobacter thiogenes TaxID=115783 RepID=A0A1T4PYF8_9BACT|nr:DUF309 domain-containing protein [Trichlorobacter thiogenes]SJZ96600.1 hypothetical protein SAMN02745119_02162 [Trichlorobacter thiogenes]
MSASLELTKICQDSPSGQLLLGIRQFNAGQWYECHETLELLWIPATGDLRTLYQGIIQIAIALHHWRNGNFNGAISLLDGGVDYLSKLPQICLWIDVAELITQAESVKKQLEGLGKARMAELDTHFIPKIVTASV